MRAEGNERASVNTGKRGTERDEDIFSPPGFNEAERKGERERAHAARHAGHVSLIYRFPMLMFY